MQIKDMELDSCRLCIWHTVVFGYKLAECALHRIDTEGWANLHIPDDTVMLLHIVSSAYCASNG